ncbi:MAG: sodium/sugar symporter [Gammaproteobacteria bacterium]|nr:sodium/sugar symporter [Gammaproteobacteria bacterium]
MKLSPIDLTIFVGYCLLIIAIGLLVSREKTGHSKDSKDYFLASKALPWWAIGASLIAANISAEQFIGMSGSGFAIGLAIASYEWMAAATLLIVGKFFLPVFIEKQLYTIPEFLEQRYSTNLKSILAVFWIALFVFVNLTSVLYLGSKALDTIMGAGDGSLIMPSIIGLALFAAAYSLWGGLKAVAWTDVVQVVILIGGGLITTYIALGHYASDGSIFTGFRELMTTVPAKFSMIIDKGEIITPNGTDAYWDLPGLAVLIGGMWIANLYYWGFNQYIIQRTLAAKNISEAQKGIVFAAFLKLIIPLIVVIPGIIAFALNAPDGVASTDTVADAFITASGTIDNDKALPWLIDQFIPVGVKGLVIAALTAAIVSSLASMLNSTATIFTMDLYKPIFNRQASEGNIVKVGRLSATVALIIACFIAPLLGDIGQAFQYIQEYTGLVSPGILAIFMLGLFWKKTTNKGAIIGALLSIPIAFYLKIGGKGWFEGEAINAIFPKLAFMNQMGLTFIITAIIMMTVSYLEQKGADDPKGISLNRQLFSTGPAFNIGAFAILIILAALYAVFW